jgi:hypothetical protein
LKLSLPLRRAPLGAVVLGLGLVLAAAPVSAEPGLLDPSPVFGFGSEWAYLDGSLVLERGWAAELPHTWPSEEAWLTGPSPFLGRSTATEALMEAERERARRRARRQRRTYRPEPADGTLLLYDSARHPAAEGSAPYEPGPNALYFVRTFEVADVADVVSMFLEVRFSGGFIAYLNGREWVRHNVNAGSPPDAPASIVWQPEWVAQTVGNVWQRAYVGLDPSWLREGENVLAVEVRRRGDGGRRPLFFDAQLRAFRDRGFVRTPYLQRVQSDEITVMWETSTPAIGYVEFGAGELLERVATSPRTASTLQQVVLTGLEPDTRYYYRVHSVALEDAGGEPSTVSSPIFHFRTGLGPGTPFTFMLYGDNRTGHRTHTRLIERMQADANEADARFFLNTGDLTTHGSWWDQWQTEFFRPALPMMAYFPLYAVLGNHEGNHETYYEYLEHPGNESWYSFEYGDAEFFALNTSARFEPGSAQHTWLEQALAASDATWKIAFFHHPPFSCVPSRKPGNRNVVDYLVPLFEQYGVDLVLLGHDHLYGRSVPVNGVIYVISGGGGAATYPAEPDAVNEICVRVHHYCILRVSDATLELEAITLEGELLDQLVLERAERQYATEPVQVCDG